MRYPTLADITVLRGLNMHFHWRDVLASTAKAIVRAIDSENGISADDVKTACQTIARAKRQFVSSATPEVRKVMLAAGVFPDGATAVSAFQENVARFDSLIAACKSLDQARRARQADSYIDDDGDKMEVFITSPDSDALRAAAVAVRDELA